MKANIKKHYCQIVTKKSGEHNVYTYVTKKLSELDRLQAKFKFLALQSHSSKYATCLGQLILSS